MRISLPSTAAFLALTLLVVPDVAQAQGGILGRARRSVERGVNRAADRAQNQVEDEAENQADQALSSALGEVGDGISSALGLRGSSSGSLENGDLVDSDITFERGTATLTSDSRERLTELGRRLGRIEQEDLRSDMRLNIKGYTHSGVSRSLAQRRADAARTAITRGGNLRGRFIQINAGTAPGDADLGVQLIQPSN